MERLEQERLLCGLGRARQNGEGEKKGKSHGSVFRLTRDGNAVRRRVQNALKVMIVRVSTMPGIVCTFWPTKWPMSTSRST